MSAIKLLEHFGKELEKKNGEINRDNLALMIKEAANEYKQLEIEFDIVNIHYRKLIELLGEEKIVEIINKGKYQQIEKVSGIWDDWIKDVKKPNDNIITTLELLKKV